VKLAVFLCFLIQKVLFSQSPVLPMASWTLWTLVDSILYFNALSWTALFKSGSINISMIDCVEPAVHTHWGRLFLMYIHSHFAIAEQHDVHESFMDLRIRLQVGNSKWLQVVMKREWELKMRLISSLREAISHFLLGKSLLKRQYYFNIIPPTLTISLFGRFNSVCRRNLVERFHGRG
jgi:hypothetical protein